MLKSKNRSTVPVQQKSDSESMIQRKAAPPQFGLGASPLQRNGNKNPDILPDHANNLGVTYQDSSGPVSVQGAGDSHAIAYNDVQQGAIADCYFLASLTALAKNNPGLIEQNIDGPLDDGTYNIRLYKKKFMGGFESRIYNVAPSFPTDGSGHRMYSTGEDTNAAGQREIWVSLIQKAYASMLGSYNELAWGWSENALEALTGQQHSSHGFGGLFGGKSEATIKAEVMAALQAGKPVTASTGSDGSITGLPEPDKTFAATNQIVGRHVYTVLSGSDTHVRVRNPWGGSNAEVVMTWAQFKTFYKEYTTRD